MGNLKKYLDVCKKIRKERGEYCECCGVPSRHMHHIMPVSETSIHSIMVYEESNLMILCDDCHLLMHPLIRRPEWGEARKGRGRALNRRS